MTISGRPVFRSRLTAQPGRNAIGMGAYGKSCERYRLGVLASGARRRVSKTRRHVEGSMGSRGGRGRTQRVVPLKGVGCGEEVGGGEEGGIVDAVEKRG